MPQTSTIAFALIIGYIVFITVRGELAVYLGVLGFGPNANNLCTPTTSTSTSSAPAQGSAGNPVSVSQPITGAPGGITNPGLPPSGSTWDTPTFPSNPTPPIGSSTSTITYDPPPIDDTGGGSDGSYPDPSYDGF